MIAVYFITFFVHLLPLERWLTLRFKSLGSEISRVLLSKDKMSFGSLKAVRRSLISLESSYFLYLLQSKFYFDAYQDCNSDQKGGITSRMW
jgi:hypothetical protein